MDSFVRELLTEWRRLELPSENAVFIAAVSGGADSVSLLLALDDLKKRQKLKNRLVIAHFDHGIRGVESSEDADHVIHLAGKLTYELVLGNGNVAQKGNLEQNAREARYAFLAETAARLHAFGILTAHTMNDQAETFLLNLIRGSGVKGLSGMRPIRELNVGDNKSRLVRPMLRWAKRRATEDFCGRSGVEVRYDTMNDDLSFMRVRVRKLLLPMLTDLNPNIIETLARTAELMHNSLESQNQLDVTQNSEKSDQIKSAELVLADLKVLSGPDLQNTIRKWLGDARGGLRSLDLKHIEAIERLVRSTKSGRIVELPGGERVCKQSGKLVFENIKVDK